MTRKTAEFILVIVCMLFCTLIFCVYETDLHVKLHLPHDLGDKYNIISLVEKSCTETNDNDSEIGLDLAEENQ